MNFIAMNRFKIKKNNENDFIKLWKNRDSQLDNVPGFLKFNLIKGKTEDDYTIFASHSIWRTNSDFINWTNSQAFRDAHKNAGSNKHMYIGHPEFEGFEVIL